MSGWHRAGGNFPGGRVWISEGYMPDIPCRPEQLISSGHPQDTHIALSVSTKQGLLTLGNTVTALSPKK